MTEFTVYAADDAPEAAKLSYKTAQSSFGSIPKLQPDGSVAELLARMEKIGPGVDQRAAQRRELAQRVVGKTEDRLTNG